MEFKIKLSLLHNSGKNHFGKTWSKCPFDWLQKIKRGWKSARAPLLTGLVGVEFQKPWLTARMTLPGLESSHRKLLTQVLCSSRSRAGATKLGNKKALEHWSSCGFHCSTAGSGVLGCHGSEGQLCSTRAISRLLLSRTSRRQLKNAPVESSTSLGSASTSQQPFYPGTQTSDRTCDKSTAGT